MSEAPYVFALLTMLLLSLLLRHIFPAKCQSEALALVKSLGPFGSHHSLKPYKDRHTIGAQHLLQPALPRSLQDKRRVGQLTSARENRNFSSNFMDYLSYLSYRSAAFLDCYYIFDFNEFGDNATCKINVSKPGSSIYNTIGMSTLLILTYNVRIFLARLA